jgi:GDP/UDP-N,N'-diacetylbacillosamine 2-epimerase (hydrolysing)
MAVVDGIIGNSSSGILEAPTLKVGAVNIGSRQLGRSQSENVINSPANKIELEKALDKLLSLEFQATLEFCKSPYGEGGASIQILQILRKASFEGILGKSFYDLQLVNEVHSLI